jgi:hypothetical protein
MRNDELPERPKASSFFSFIIYHSALALRAFLLTNPATREHNRGSPLDGNAG